MKQLEGLQIQSQKTDNSRGVTSIEYGVNLYGVRTAIIIASKDFNQEGETYPYPILISGDISILRRRENWEDYFQDNFPIKEVRPDMNTLFHLQEKYRNYPSKFAIQASEILSRNKLITHIGMGMRQVDNLDGIQPSPSAIILKISDIPLGMYAIPNDLQSFKGTLQDGGFNTIIQKGEKIQYTGHGIWNKIATLLQKKNAYGNIEDKNSINTHSMLRALQNFRSHEPYGQRNNTKKEQKALNTKHVNDTELFVLAGRKKDGSLFLTVADLIKCVAHDINISLEGLDFENR